MAGANGINRITRRRQITHRHRMAAMATKKKKKAKKAAKK